MASKTLPPAQFPSQLSVETDPLLVPDSPENQKRKPGKKSAPSILPSKPFAAMRVNPPSKPGEPRFTLAEAYSCDLDDDCWESADLEKAVRSVSFLLDWASQGGNSDVDGFLAYGMSRTLDQCANAVQHLQKRGGLLKRQSVQL